MTTCFPGSSDGKESACNTGDPVSIWVRKIPWRRKWQPTPVFLPGKFHGQRSLAGYSSWNHRELDIADNVYMLISLFIFSLELRCQSLFS